MTRTQIRQFLALVDAGNFTLAARRINVAQPTLSMGIGELEKRLGSQLFIREKRRIRLTEAGARLLPYARSIEQKFSLAESTITALPVPAKPVRLGLLHSISTLHVEEALATYAGSPVEIIEGSDRELSRALANGGVDMALTILPGGKTPEHAFELYSEPYLIALPEGHRLADRETVSATELAGETMIARRSCELLNLTSQFFTERGVRPPFSLRTANDERAMAMVRAGIGLTLAPLSLEREGIVMVRLEKFDLQRTIGLIFNADWLSHFGKDHPLPRSFFRTLRR